MQGYKTTLTMITQIDHLWMVVGSRGYKATSSASPSGSAFGGLWVHKGAERMGRLVYHMEKYISRRKAAEDINKK